MHLHAELLEQFYSSFARRDYAGMIACYAPEIRFSDPVFTLSGKRAGAMWHMLCVAGSDLVVAFRDIQADQQSGTAHWEAQYTFSGRKVHNRVDATFQFQDGLITQHDDHFGFWRWSQMALGPTGWLLGWTPLLQRQVQRSARQRLERFIATHAEYRD